MNALTQRGRSSLQRFAAFAPGLARVLLAAGLAATLATLLLVAKNQLAPVQRPLTFGLVFWGWFLVLYLALVLPGGLAVLLLARLTRRPRLPRAVPALAALAFLGLVLGSNLDALPLLLSLEGPTRFRWLLPAAGLFCVLALLCIVACPRRKRATHRLLAVLAAAAGLGALLPARNGATRADKLPAAAPKASGERLLVVGVDGADWDYMTPLIDRGDLPNLAALRERAAWGELETLRPTLSPPIWTSIVTGKAPEDHGVRQFSSPRLAGVDQPLPRIRPVKLAGYGWLHAGLQRVRQIDQVSSDSTERQVPAFWNIATAHGSPVNVVSWWTTWPAEPVLGAVVTEALHSSPPGPDNLPRVGGLTYPDRLYGEIAHLIMRPAELTYDQARLFLDLTPAEYRAILAREGTGIDKDLTYFVSYFETTRRIALHLLRQARARGTVPPDTLLLFRIVDKMCHTALADSELVAERLRSPADRVRRYGQAVSGAYRAVDQALGEIMSAFGEGSVVVVSDHGFAVRREKGGRLLADHKLGPKGVFMAAGPPFRPGRVEGLSVHDVLPLLLYAKGFPIADDFVEALDTRVIASEFLAHHPVRRLASYGRRDAHAAAAHDRDMDAEALEHLRTLGYIQ